MSGGGGDDGGGTAECMTVTSAVDLVSVFVSVTSELGFFFFCLNQNHNVSTTLSQEETEDRL